MFFSNKQVEDKSSCFLGKREEIKVRIRRKALEQKFRQLRQLNFHQVGSCIANLVKLLPQTTSELVYLLQVSQGFEQLTTKLLIERMFGFNQYQQGQVQSKKKQFKDMFEDLQPERKDQFKEQLYLLNILLENQGMFAQQILDRYFQLFLQKAEKFQMIQQLFLPLNIVVSNQELYWVPTKHIEALQRKFLQTPKQHQFWLSNYEIKIYENLAHHYFYVFESSAMIKNRLIEICQKGSQTFANINPKYFFKLVLRLTSKETLQTEESEKSNLDFHQALIKGNIWRNVFRQIFYTSKSKLKRLCLDILWNLIFEFGSDMIWKQQKLDPVYHFNAQIRNKDNDYKTFQGLCQCLLLSILKVPSGKHLANVFEGQINIIDLLLYILENNENKQITDLVCDCLYLFLQHCDEGIQIKLANTLKNSEWQNQIGEYDFLYERCKCILETASEIQI